MEQNDDLLMQSVRELQCPKLVDVTQSVMDYVREHPLPHQHKNILTNSFFAPNRKWVGYVAAVAACVLLFLSVNVVMLFTKDYNEERLGDLFVSVYDYGSNADYAVDSDMDYLYYLGE
ncbi:MAG: hypothetical protein KBT04_07945 [Bacteroidales bacterium]|nr:hypothetical protein [Candidatus Colimorpha onthohippi]